MMVFPFSYQSPVNCHTPVILNSAASRRLEALFRSHGSVAFPEAKALPHTDNIVSGPSWVSVDIGRPALVGSFWRPSR